MNLPCFLKMIMTHVRQFMELQSEFASSTVGFISVFVQVKKRANPAQISASIFHSMCESFSSFHVAEDCFKQGDVSINIINTGTSLSSPRQKYLLPRTRMAISIMKSFQIRRYDNRILTLVKFKNLISRILVYKSKQNCVCCKNK